MMKTKQTKLYVAPKLCGHFVYARQILQGRSPLMFLSFHSKETPTICVAKIIWNPYLHDESRISSTVAGCFRRFPAAVSPGGLQTLVLCSSTTTTTGFGDVEPTTTGAVVEGDPHIHTFEGETLGISWHHLVLKAKKGSLGFSWVIFFGIVSYFCEMTKIIERIPAETSSIAMYDDYSRIIYIYIYICM